MSELSTSFSKNCNDGFWYSDTANIWKPNFKSSISKPIRSYPSGDFILSRSSELEFEKKKAWKEWTDNIIWSLFEGWISLQNACRIGANLPPKKKKLSPVKRQYFEYRFFSRAKPGFFAWYIVQFANFWSHYYSIGLTLKNS